MDLAPSRLRDVPLGFQEVGAAIGREQAAANLINNWHSIFEAHSQHFAEYDIGVAFLDWLDPPFAAGHWIPDMVEWLGARNLLASPGEPSHETSWQEVSEAQPDLIVAACCGRTEDQARTDAVGCDFTIQCLDGYELFSRPSPKLIDSLSVLGNTLATHVQSHG